ncbi:MAG TPA: hypothetical protein PLK19_03480 [Mycobacterium sp.]|nr:hypothetical protein [Mycobacterium sp.]
MDQPTESVTDSATHTAPAPISEAAPSAPVQGCRPKDRPNRVYQAAAWVAIVAGIVFIVGAIFFTGFALGRHSGHGGGWDGFRHQRGVMMPPPMGPGMMGPGMMGPGMMGPDGPGMRGPGGAPTTSPPAPPER